jgi:hypothetical protein
MGGVLQSSRLAARRLNDRTTTGPVASARPFDPSIERCAHDANVDRRRSTRGRRRRAQAGVSDFTMDVISLGLMVGFFVLSVAFVALCDRL